MIQLTPQTKVYVAVSPIDFRNGILGIKKFCREIHNKNSESGAFFVFKNRKKNCIKILCFDGQGFWLMTKRLSRGKFPWWPAGDSIGQAIDHKKLQLIINAAIDAEFSDDWKRLV